MGSDMDVIEDETVCPSDVVVAVTYDSQNPSRPLAELAILGLIVA